MLRRLLFPPIAAGLCRKLYAQLGDAVPLQEKLLAELLRQGASTAYGKAHSFSSLRSYDDFRKATPLITYEELKPYVDRIAAGERNVLWPGRPDFFALSSGTSSGVKHIPVTKEALQAQRRGRLLHAANFTARLGLSDVHKGNFILFADSHHFTPHGGIPSAAISAILSSTLPFYVKQRDYPSPQTQQLKNYDEKITAMVRETMNQRITGIVALPPWLSMFLKRVPEISGRSFAETYPHFRLLSTSGMSFEPYRQSVTELIGRSFAHLQTYPSSEGFFGFQHALDDPSILLLPQNGIFFEFVPESEWHDAAPRRFMLSEVELNVPYALVISTNAGLWSYLPGDLVEFTSLRPAKIRILGRVGNILNAFGEHLTAHECETLIAQACREQDCSLSDFVLFPVLPEDGALPFHRWYIEFSKAPSSLPAFAARLDELLAGKNLCYRDLIHGKAMRPLEIKILPGKSFQKLREESGRTGTQQKTKRFATKETTAFLDSLGGS